MTDTPEPLEALDALVGRNVQELRKAQGMTQTDLANEVTERGIPFRQQTVVKIEQGKRPLRLTEADAVARALNVSVDALVAERVVIDLAAMLASHTRALADAWTEANTALEGLVRARESVRFALGSVVRKGQHDRVPKELLDEAATLVQVDPVMVAESVKARGMAQRGVDEAELIGAVESRTFRAEEYEADVSEHEVVMRLLESAAARSPGDRRPTEEERHMIAAFLRRETDPTAIESVADQIAGLGHGELAAEMREASQGLRRQHSPGGQKNERG
jgi:transcriptional regulator with XRE-family HTH domain